MSGMFGIGLSGLNVAQAHLTTVSHNITNANTEGYSRQRVIQVANDAEYGGAGFFGRGSQVSNVTRAYNSFLDQQVQSSTARQAQYAAYNAQITQINNMLADPEVGLSPVLNSFFAGVQDVVANPTSVPARQALLSTAQDLSGRFRAMDARLQEISSSTDGEIAYNVGRINNIASQIAELNERISLAQASGGGVQANDLQDQRNNLMVELNSIILARGVPSSDGSLNVFIGTGQALVLGNSLSEVTTMADPDNPQRLRVAIQVPGGANVLVPEETLTNGALGGLLDFRREALDTTRRQFDVIARSFMEAVNALHRAGVDLDGLPGGDLFGPGMVRGVGGASNPPAVSIENDGLLTYDSYRLTFDDSNPAGYVLQRERDGALITDPAELGLSITLPDAPANGESYLITPLAGAARDISVAISDPARFAAGLPTISETTYNAAASVLQTGGGSGVLSLAASAFEANGDTIAPFTMLFNGATNELSLPAGYTLESGDPLAADASYDPLVDGVAGKTFTITTPENESIRFTLQGAPNDGNTFAFSFDVTVTEAVVQSGPGDNRNAVAIGALQTTQLMLHSAGGTPTATVQSAYSQLVSFVGNKTREVQTAEKAQTALLQQATDARESFAGVNLDEEAANLVRYQQAYQAAGRVMTVAQRLFEDVLTFGR